MTDLKKGDIILSREDSFFSRLIRTVTRSDWSHASVYCGEGQFISAVPLKGVCKQDVSVLNDYVVFRVKQSSTMINLDELGDIVVCFCEDRLGKSYDFLQCCLLGWRVMTKTIGIFGDDPNKSSYECLELVSEAYASVGIRFTRMVDNLLPNQIVQSSLLECVSEGRK